MGYMKIQNLYKDKKVLAFKQCYALEKIHGTSAHIKKDADGNISIYPGGESIGNLEPILAPAGELLKATDPTTVTVFGEAYGGKQQGMRDTYGNATRFSAFDVMINDRWLSVPSAAEFCAGIGVHFVPYEFGPCEISWLDEQRDRDSLVAVEPGKKREGIVIRPPFEVSEHGRIIAKHKRDDFRETKTPRVVGEPSPELTSARAVADEWVTPMRMQHIVDKMVAAGIDIQLPSTPEAASRMIDDVLAEAGHEVHDDKQVRREISRAAARLFRGYCR